MTIAEREQLYFDHYFKILSQRKTMSEGDDALLREWAALIAYRSEAQEALRNGTPTYIESVGHNGQPKLSPSGPWRTLCDTNSQLNVLAAALGFSPRSRAVQKSGAHRAPENEMVKIHDPFSELLEERAG